MISRLLLGALLATCLTTFGAMVARGQTETSPRPVEIKLTARKFEFEPNVITVRKDQPVRLLITAADAEHGFEIEELGINKKLKPGAVTVVEFTPTRTGKFKFACSVMCGSGHDEMNGELIVTDAQAGPGNLQVTFDETNASVVIVETGGERVRIDTQTKTVTKLPPVEPTTRETVATEAPQSTELEQKHVAADEPYDYRLVNVPTPKRVVKGSVNLYFTHRFAQPVRPLTRSDQDLFGLDSFAVSSFGLFYGITDRLYVSAYRSPICQPGLCKTVELGLGYHLLDERGRSPIALSAYASIEGDDNFRKFYTYNLQFMVARSIGKHLNFFFSPALHLNANANRRFDPKPTDFFPPEPLAEQFNQDKHAMSFGWGVNARIRPTISLMFEYTPRIGFKLGRVDPIFDPNFRITGFESKSEAELGFGIAKDVGRHTFALTFSNTQTTTTSRYNSSNQVLQPSRFTIGFNLYRRFLR
ncbi:MAG: DUF5777 family beta-barrel protein [Pyrinomonadaceae bacterium]